MRKNKLQQRSTFFLVNTTLLCHQLRTASLTFWMLVVWTAFCSLFFMTSFPANEEGIFQHQRFNEYCNKHPDLRETVCGGITSFCSTPEQAEQCQNLWKSKWRLLRDKLPSLAEVEAHTSLMQEAQATSWPGDLQHIADSSGRVIVLLVSCAYLDMLDNIAHSMVNLGVMNFVIVPLDEMAYKVAKQLYPGNTIPPMPGIPKAGITDKPADYETQAFIDLTATRPLILLTFLRQNYTIFYCDIDTVWQSSAVLNMLEAASVKAETELVVTNDSDSTNILSFCSCYIYAKPSNENINAFLAWSNDIYWGQYGDDQQSFQPILHVLTNEKKSTVLPGDDKNLPNGFYYFNIFNQSQQERAMIVHNNWIVGHDKKMERFKEHSLWQPSGKLEGIPYICSQAT